MMVRVIRGWPGTERRWRARPMGAISVMAGKVLGLVAAVLLLAACETAQQDQPAGPGPGTADAGFAPGVGTGGLGQIIPGSQADLETSIGDRIFFSLDRSDLTPQARATLDRQAEWLRRYPNVLVTIEGHCDERGTREYNIGLGHRRANAARNYLVALGIRPDRIDTTSFGKERPEVLGSNESAWRQNRRAVTVVN